MRHEFRGEDLPVGWEAQVKGPPDVIMWIAARLAALGADSSSAR